MKKNHIFRTQSKSKMTNEFCIRRTMKLNWNLRTKHTLHGLNRSKQQTCTFPRAAYQNNVFEIGWNDVGGGVCFNMTRGAHWFFRLCKRRRRSFVVTTYRCWNASQQVVSNSHAIKFHPRLFHAENSTSVCIFAPFSPWNKRLQIYQ